VEIDGLSEGIDSGSSLGWRRRLDGEDGVDDGGSELGSEFGVKFGSKRGVGDGDESSSVHGLSDLEGIEELRGKGRKEGMEGRGELKLKVRGPYLSCFFDHVDDGTHLERLLHSKIVTLSDDSRVNSLGSVPLGLLEELSDEKDDRGGSISGLLVLSDGCTGDHGCGGVLKKENKVRISTGWRKSERSFGRTWICISERRTFPSWRRLSEGRKISSSRDTYGPKMCRGNLPWSF